MRFVEVFWNFANSHAPWFKPVTRSRKPRTSPTVSQAGCSPVRFKDIWNLKLHGSICTGKPDSAILNSSVTTNNFGIFRSVIKMTNIPSPLAWGIFMYEISYPNKLQIRKLTNLCIEKNPARIKKKKNQTVKTGGGAAAGHPPPPQSGICAYHASYVIATNKGISYEFLTWMLGFINLYRIHQSLM